MHADLLADSFLRFLIIAARIGAAVAFAPFGGWKAAPGAAKVVLTATLAVCLWRRAPVDPAGIGTLTELTAKLAREAAIGLSLGLFASILLETLALAAQLIGAQAGYSYASTIDPSSEADSGLMPVLGQLTAGLLMLAAGFDALLIRGLTKSYGSGLDGRLFRPENLIEAGSLMWQTAWRLALPAIAFLIVLDVVMALAGRASAHLQLLSIAFPAKMLAALALFAGAVATFPALFRWEGHRLAGWLLR